MIKDKRVRILTELRELEAIRESWENLHSYGLNATVFTSYEWVTTWFKVYNDTVANLFVIVICDSENIYGLLPLYVRKDNLSVAWFIGSGEPEMSETCSEMQDLLLSPLMAVSDLPPLSSIMSLGKIKAIYLSNIALNANLLSWCKLSKSSYIVRYIGRRYRAMTNIDNNALVKKTARIRKAANKQNAIIKRVQNPKELIEVFELLATLHTQRWSEKGHFPIFEDPLFKQFHQEILVKLLKSKRLSLVYLSVGKNVLAVNYGIISGNDLIFYQNGVDTSFKPNISPGMLLHHEQLKLARTLGLASYDFMMSSGSVSYKSKISDETEVIASVKIFNNLRQLYFQKMSGYINLIKPLVKKCLGRSHV